MGIMDVLLQGAKYAALAFIPYVILRKEHLEISDSSLLTRPMPLCRELSTVFPPFEQVSWTACCQALQCLRWILRNLNETSFGHKSRLKQVWQAPSNIMAVLFPMLTACQAL